MIIVLVWVAYASVLLVSSKILLPVLYGSSYDCQCLPAIMYITDLTYRNGTVQLLGEAQLNTVL
jgi:hypothetical protein